MVRGRDCREQIGLVTTFCSRKAYFVVGTILVGTIGAPMVLGGAIFEGIVPVGATEVTARGIVFWQFLANFAFRFREAYLTLGTIRIGAVRAPMVVGCAILDGIIPIVATEMAARGIVSSLATTPTRRRFWRAPNHFDIITFSQVGKTDLTLCTVSRITTRTMTFQTTIIIGISPSLTAETTVGYIGEVVEESMALG